MKEKTTLAKKLWTAFGRTVYFVLVKILRLKKLENHWNEVMQFIKFGLVGLSNTAVSYIVYLACIFLGMQYLLANICGFIISVINAFYWNNKYVFTLQEGGKRSLLQSFFKTLLSYAGTSLVLSNILLFLQVHYLGIHQVIAPLISMLITIPLNYLLNKFWAFSKS